MKFIKHTISLRTRLSFLRHSIIWLSTTVIDCYNHETKTWNEVPLSFKERFDCFISALETAIIGYIYKLE